MPARFLQFDAYAKAEGETPSGQPAGRRRYSLRKRTAPTNCATLLSCTTNRRYFTSLRISDRNTLARYRIGLSTAVLKPAWISRTPVFQAPCLNILLVDPAAGHDNHAIFRMFDKTSQSLRFLQQPFRLPQRSGSGQRRLPRHPRATRLRSDETIERPMERSL